MRWQDQAKVALTRTPRLYGLARRPWAAGRFLARCYHDKDYAAWRLFDRSGVFLDIGANAGMSALSYRVARRRGHIVSIEPNPFHESDLRFAGRLVRDFEYRLWAAGAEDASMMLHVPVYRGVPLTTEASLHRHAVAGSNSLRARLQERMDSPDFQIVEREVPVRPLDCLGLAPAFVKLDIQGHEHAAVVGLQETLRRSRPVLMIESADQPVRTLLGDLGYQPFSYDAQANALRPEGRALTNTFFLAGDDT